MSKEVFAKKVQLKDFLEPLIILPFGFWGIYWFENGFSWLVGIMGAVLLFVILPVFIVFWDRK